MFFLYSFQLVLKISNSSCSTAAFCLQTFGFDVFSFEICTDILRNLSGIYRDMIFSETDVISRDQPWSANFKSLWYIFQRLIMIMFMNHDELKFGQFFDYLEAIPRPALTIIYLNLSESINLSFNCDGSCSTKLVWNQLPSAPPEESKETHSEALVFLCPSSGWPEQVPCFAIPLLPLAQICQLMSNSSKYFILFDNTYM